MCYIHIEHRQENTKTFNTAPRCCPREEEKLRKLCGLDVFEGWSGQENPFQTSSPFFVRSIASGSWQEK